MAAYPELSDDEWTELVERLTQHAACLVLQHTWRGLRLAQGGKIPGGVDPAGLAADAIADVIERRREWNRDAYPEFLNFLRSVVDSRVSHLVNGLENRHSRRLPDENADRQFDAPGREPDPAVEVIERDALETRRAEIGRELGSDKLAAGLLDCMAEGVTKPEEIAVLLDVTVTEVNNAQKRLTRKAEKIVKNTPRR